MKKVAPINQRKADHIRINLEENVQSGQTTGLELYHFVHEALPEVDYEATDLTQTLFGKKINAPILVSSMTGGTEESTKINHHLAEAVQEAGVAMGVGSQRIALDDPKQTKSFTIIRKIAPSALLFANLGAVQLNYGYNIDHCRRAVDMIRADALILHLNPLQEALQNGGDTNFTGLAKKIEDINRLLDVPLIIKEVGWGISEQTAKRLIECGVAAIDVAGAGGTSWSQVEMNRAEDDFMRQLAKTFIDWGIPTVESILNVKRVSPSMIVFASGGLKNGVDIAKCIALGASLGGMAGTFLKSASLSSENTINQIRLIKQQIQVTLFATGSHSLKDIKNKLYKKP